MVARRIGNQRFRSRSAAAVHLAKTTKLTNQAISKRVKMTPQTVCAAISRVLGR